MKTHRLLLICGTLAASALVTGCATGPEVDPGITGASGGRPLKSASLLFVQNAQGVSFGDGTMTLRGVHSTTIAFSDRPERFAGHMPTSNFVPMWSEGKDSFLKDPPNATLSVLSDNDASSVVVTLRNPRLSGSNLTYDVTVLEGAPPAHSGSASLFIDVIGMPLTPMSYAGAGRRHHARDCYYAGGNYGPKVVHYNGYNSSGKIKGAYGGKVKWDDGSGKAKGARGGKAKWSDGSGSATGWRGNSVSWKRKK